ncbi:hypothetical protein OBBRIDRAFT_329112 [Obba rivulosa]|uniref:Uncharacterized protein n=1 Tax=Obba rivulosa TaxID=1052685 RepID=A0A8E2DPH9_9APHY|nr:hypothetical protein OBBRIDRAFT_329112 [Obba rivulosa]
MFALLALTAPNTTIFIPPTIAPPSKKTVNIGAIEGAIGGLCTVGIIVAAILLWKHRSRKRSKPLQTTAALIVQAEPFPYGKVSAALISDSTAVQRQLSSSGPDQVVRISAVPPVPPYPEGSEAKADNSRLRRVMSQTSAVLEEPSISQIIPIAALEHVEASRSTVGMSNTDMQNLLERLQILQREVYEMQVDTAVRPPSCRTNYTN